MAGSFKYKAATLTLLVAVALCGKSLAQTSADPTLDATTAAIQSMVKAPTGPAAALTPERIALAQTYMAKLHMHPGSEGVALFLSAQLKSQIDAQVKSLTPKKEAIIRTAYSKAISATAAEIDKLYFYRMRDYYAGYISPDEFREVLAFYDTPLGGHYIAMSPPLTADERQQLNRYIVEHLAIQKVFGVQFSVAKMMSANLLADQPRIVTAFKEHLCQSLASSGVGSSACAATRHG